ncbi:MAG TPA: hypothetical protein VLA49_08370 [Anaerolineales bacterium]|nr:hypothetical protein [Anaerolineales bacterium]
MMNSRNLILFALVWVQALAILACSIASTPGADSQITPLHTTGIDQVGREAKIPTNAVKMSPETDEQPPRVLSDEFESPVPVPGSVNTAGGEDSPFILPDGNTLYFFFTPNVNELIEKQIKEGVTGIYVSKMVAGSWGEPERIILQEPGKLAMDRCAFVAGDIMWFCTVREGYTVIQWFTAEFMDGKWQNWKIVEFNPDYKVGELHLTSDGNELYFHSARPGGKGQLDIWVMKKSTGIWQEPVNVSAVNTRGSEGWPALNPQGDELWFTRNEAIWRSKKVNGEWQIADLIVSPSAREPSIDSAGNLYFTHYFSIDGRMIEEDIYVAYKK